MERTADRCAFQFGDDFYPCTPPDARRRPPSLILLSLDAVSRRDSRRHYSQAVSAEKTRLSALPAEELRNLPEHHSVRRLIDDTPVDVSIWHHRHSVGGELIVAQAFRPWLRWFRGAGQMFVEGFVVQPDGRVIPAEDRDLWDYT
jgi:hypothetical protein